MLSCVLACAVIKRVHTVMLHCAVVMSAAVFLLRRLLIISFICKLTAKMSADFMDVLKKGPVKIKGKHLGVNNFCAVGDTFHNLLLSSSHFSA